MTALGCLRLGPFALPTDLPRLATSARRPLDFKHEPDDYPITELLGRLLVFADESALPAP